MNRLELNDSAYKLRIVALISMYVFIWIARSYIGLKYTAQKLMLYKDHTRNRPSRKLVV